jgi:hypothetical protein
MQDIREVGGERCGVEKKIYDRYISPGPLGKKV